MADIPTVLVEPTAQPTRALLVVGGIAYDGWTSISIERSLENVASSFSFAATRRTSSGTPVYPTQECEVWIDGERVISGYIDSVTQSMDSQSAGLTVNGRSRTAQLVDASAPPGARWRLLSLDAIARSLATPLGVDVTTDVPFPPIPRAGVDRGESCYAVLERLARTQGCVLTDDPDGALVLGLVGASEAASALRLGVNILDISHTTDASQRYSAYVCRGQRIATPLDYGATVAESVAEVTDGGMPLARTLEIDPEQSATSDDCRRRALWEARVRAGRSVTVECSVQGWTQIDGSLWSPGLLVWVWAEEVGIEGQLVIGSCSHTLDSAGTRTRMTLHPLDAYQPQPQNVPASPSPSPSRRIDPKPIGLWQDVVNAADAAGFPLILPVKDATRRRR